MATPYYVKALLFDGEPRWNSDQPVGTPVNVTYSFPTSDSEDSNGTSFVAFNPAQQAVIGLILQYWEDVADITFTLAQEGTEGQIHFGMTAKIGGQGRSDNYPGPGITNYTWIQSYWNDAAHVDTWNGKFDTINGTFLRWVVLHEVGHAIGLNHPGPYNDGQEEDPDAYFKNPGRYLPLNEDNSQYSIMSYNDGTHGRTKYTGSKADSATPLLYDIAAAQYLYGVNYKTRIDDDIYRFENPNMVYKMAIWDAGGLDTISAANQTLDAIINLNNGSFSSIGSFADDNKDSAVDNVAIAFEVKDSAGDIINLIENATGGSGNDKIYGNLAANVLDGGAGDDKSYGGDGNDTLYGSAGNDTLAGNNGSDVLIGGDGNDILVQYDDSYAVGVDSGSNFLDGGAGDDILSGGSGHDTLYGGSGNDSIESGDGDDVIDGGEGNDKITCFGLNSTAHGGSGDDYLTGGYGNDTLFGDVDSDYIDGGGGGDDVLHGGSGSDTLRGFNGDNILYGEDGNDTLYAIDSGTDALYGGAGDDTYIVDSNIDQITENENEGIDTVNASINYILSSNLENLNLTGSNDTSITGNELNNTINGNTAVNYIYAGEGADLVVGAAGNDYIYGEAGDDSLSGNEGSDNLNGGLGNDVVSGNKGQDWLVGDLGNDQLLGDAGKDHITGGVGNDVITGGAGKDWLTGGAGADQFVFYSRKDRANIITDFHISDGDRIIISAKGFGENLKIGKLSTDRFTLGSAATDASDRFIYNSSTGKFFFDADGEGKVGQIQIATLSKGLSLTSLNIVVTA